MLISLGYKFAALLGTQPFGVLAFFMVAVTALPDILGYSVTIGGVTQLSIQRTENIALSDSKKGGTWYKTLMFVS